MHVEEMVKLREKVILKRKESGVIKEIQKGESSLCTMLAQPCYPIVPRRPRTKVRSCKKRLVFDDMTPSTASQKRKRFDLFGVHASEALKSSKRMNLKDESLSSAELKLNFHYCEQNKISHRELMADDKCESHKEVPILGTVRDKEQDERQNGEKGSKLVQEGKNQHRSDLEPSTPLPVARRSSSRKCPVTNSTNRLSHTRRKCQEDNHALQILEETAAKARYYTRFLNQIVLNQIEMLKGQEVSNHTGQSRNLRGQLKMTGERITLKGQEKKWSKKLQTSSSGGTEAMREWKKLLKAKGSAQCFGAKTDEKEGIFLEDETQIFHMIVLKFINQVGSIQGPREYLPWKGSVLDSVIGAFLTQRTFDTLSSFAFMSLGARFPQHSGFSEYSKHHRMLREKRSNALRSHYNPAFGLKNKLDELSKLSFDEKKKEITPRKGKDPMKGKSIPDWSSLRAKYSGDEERERSIDAVDYVDWVAVTRANVVDISKAISLRGMNKKLAKRIKDLLERLVLHHGNLDLEWMRKVPPQKAKEFFLSITGLGLKSGECVRLLTLKQPAFPVDINVARVTVRLGWVPAPEIDDTPKMHLLKQNSILHELIHQYLWPRLCKLDQKTLYELHYQMITFGKVYCTNKKPNCGECPMKMDCKYYVGTDNKRKKLGQPHNNTKGYVAIHASGKQKASPVEQTRPFFRKRCESMTTCKSSDLKVDIEDLCSTYSVEAPKTPEKNQPLLKLRPQRSKNAYENVAPTIERLPNKSRTRTEHFVYELPDWHPILEMFDDRDPDDSSPYLLVTWEPAGEPMVKNTMSISASHVKRSRTVPGTIMIPCRTALRGKFPLNGTYFQTNEVFADHETSQIPIDVRRNTLQQAPRKTLYCGTDLARIVKGLSADEIQGLFNKGYICIRGFDRKTSTPKALHTRFHRSSQRK